MVAAFAFKTYPKCFFQPRADILERWCVTRLLDARQTVAGIGGQQPGQVLGFGQRGLMG